MMMEVVKMLINNPYVLIKKDYTLATKAIVKLRGFGDKRKFSWDDGYLKDDPNGFNSSELQQAMIDFGRVGTYGTVDDVKKRIQNNEPVYKKERMIEIVKRIEANLANANNP